MVIEHADQVLELPLILKLQNDVLPTVVVVGKEVEGYLEHLSEKANYQKEALFALVIQLV